MEKKDVKIGQEYYWSPRGYYIGEIPAKVKITSLDRGYPEGKIIEPKIIGTQGFFHGRLFETSKEAKDHYYNELDEIKNDYRSEINSIEDLVIFCLDNCVSNSDEYTDYEAREVAIEKAKDFGVIP